MCTVRTFTDREIPYTIRYILQNGERGNTEPFYFADDDDFAMRMYMTTDTPLVQSALMSEGVYPEEVESFIIRPFFENDTIYISNHAMDRLRKRMGWTREAAIKMTKKACEQGKGRDEVSPAMRRWIDRKERESGAVHGPTTFMIYGQVVYVFSGCVLCTVYEQRSKQAYRENGRKKEGYRRAEANREWKEAALCI